MENDRIVRMLRDHYPGFMALRCIADLDKYDDAIEAFVRNGGKREYLASLMALGLRAGEARWHAEYPGRRMAVVVLSDVDPLDYTP